MKKENTARVIPVTIEADTDSKEPKSDRQLKRKEQPTPINFDEVAIQKIPVSQIASTIQEYFLDLPALNQYVSYLEGHAAEKTPLKNIELPDGQPLEKLQWTKNDLTRLIKALKERAEEQERIAFLENRLHEITTPSDAALQDRAQIYNAISDKVAQKTARQEEVRNWQKKLDGLIQTEEKLRAELAQEEKYGIGEYWAVFINKIRGSGVESEKEKSIRTKKHDLMLLEAEQHRLAEDIQMALYRERKITEKDSEPLRSGVRLTPRSLLEQEELQRATQEDREAAKNISRLEPGTSNLEEGMREYGITEELGPDEKIEPFLLTPMTPDTARILLPQAEQVSSIIEQKLEQRPEAKKSLDALVIAGYKHPVAKYIFALAQYIQANQKGDKYVIRELGNRIIGLNKALQINDAQYRAFLGNPGPTDVTRGTKQRQRNTQKQNSRWKM